MLKCGQKVINTFDNHNAYERNIDDAEEDDTRIASILQELGAGEKLTGENFTGRDADVREEVVGEISNPPLSQETTRFDGNYQCIFSNF